MATSAHPETRKTMTRIEAWVGHHLLGLVLLSMLVMVSFIIVPLILAGGRATSVNWFDISSIPVILGGFAVAMSIPERSERTLTQLADRQVLQVSPTTLNNLKHDFTHRAGVSARYGAIFGLVLFLVVDTISAATLLAVLHQDVSLGDSLKVALTMVRIAFIVPVILVIGSLAGYYCGYAFSVGRWATFLKDRGETLRVRPGHLDGAAGWGPVGRLYFIQAIMLGMPAVYYGLWYILITANVAHSFERYSALQIPYLAFFVILLIFEALAFVAPVWSFHNDMLEQRSALTGDTDKLSDRILTVQARVVATDDPDEAYKLSQQLVAMTSQYHTLRNLPAWPVNTSVSLRFILGNVGLLLPVLAQALWTHFVP